ncbi:MAG TPA: DUF5684 domain-containing protein [Chitinophagaceae bacterium]|jgi:hypothetical protein|nr:DUF5684 domain-containing protein [Chitinophagaceae bacterium]
MEQNYPLPFFFSSIFIICWLTIYIFLIVAKWKVFVKAGKPGWAAIIPIYNLIVLCQIGGKPGWWVIPSLLVPFFIIWPYNMISKSFGHDEGFTVGLVLLGIVFWPILGFGSSKYVGPYGNPEAFRAYQEQHKFDFENKQ